ncbi:Uma2 family endonuclease [Tumidithrix elongata RA019]|uniref:Uma2 family endonuclease n=1 Tax=Tumidithrix elongata BACA0141 TaxID=2716417 RepID=A0AAW9Q8F3_9CYAN|nr:Uma2 family endonuclease [Tumidithrix elongata RA019]
MSPPTLRWTTRDLEALPDDEWVRREIIDGELFVTRAPHYKHQQTIRKILRLLDTWSEATGLGEVILTPGVIYTDTDNVIPDLVWVSRDRLALLLDDAGHLTGSPELVIEILSEGSTNEQRDRSAKLKLYSQQGVCEYWIVNWQLKQVEVYRREDAKLTLIVTLFEPDELTSPLLPNFCCRVAQFFV